MICNELYNGQGLGNQLWCYVVARIIAKKNNYDFGIVHSEKFKGKEFLNINFGISELKGLSPEGGPPYKLPKEIDNYYREQKKYLKNTKIDTTGTDKNLLNIHDNTKFDGNCQSTEYLKGHREDILEWIQIKSEYKKYNTDENTCIIHIRCGDYKKIKNVFLPISYYRNAMEHIKLLNKDIKFLCVTDQAEEVKKMFPDLEITGSSKTKIKDSNKATHHFGGPIGIDFCLMMNAKYLIIPNSSFSWWAAYLNTSKKIVIAPKYWTSYNKSNGYWSPSDIITDEFIYMDRDGKIFKSKECIIEKEKFEDKNKDLFVQEVEDKNKILKLHEFIYLLIKDKIGIIKNKIKKLVILLIL